jgi:phosphohistidine phosphatase
LLLRHANAAGSGPSGDHSRPLNNTGRNAAAAIGGYLAGHGTPPAAVLCSSADRAVETWRIVAAQLRAPPEARVERSLYGGDASEVLAQISEIASGARVLLVIGHNPTLHQLAFSLSQQDDGEALNRLARDFPPGALAEIEFDADEWAEIAPGSGSLVSLVTPADLV